jgi:hypothetical protein
MQDVTGGPLAGFAAVDSWAARRRTQNPFIPWAEPKTLARGRGQPDRVLRADSVLISLSVVSEARLSKLHTRVRCVCALSIQRLEGSRRRLRQMRANGYGNSIFSPICKVLVLRYLENEHGREPQFDALRWGMTCGE